MDIVLATRNRKKIQEMRKILKDGGVHNLNVLTLDDFPDCPEVIEDGETFEANAVKKAVHICRCTGLTAIADDSGLEVDALNGAPGVWSARYAGESADDAANLEKLLDGMKGVAPVNRGARFVCCIAMASGEDVRTFRGYVEGGIGTGPRGENGFGYDPVFYPEGNDRTF
ncbi:MAG TPA: RdgB/HAM1 family non-canonical purine NTP pyrophosphatase, partial [Nitrospirae bacterium]|nr:RdgB/HAM1 family non-canonical purine NTP pyrophosphatase [Nitrospirota bacterium]